MDGEEISYHYINGYVGDQVVFMQIETQNSMCGTPSVTIRYVDTNGVAVEIGSGETRTTSPAL